MKFSLQVLPGVKSIYWVDCSMLPKRVDLRGICRMPVNLLTTAHPIGIAAVDECSCVSKRDGAGFSDTASLRFLSNEELPQWLHLGFVAVDVEGKAFLIGSKEPPFPQVNVDRRAGSPNGDAAGFFYEITHVALKSLIPCIFSE